jgi:molecular chaperone HtpG
VVLHLKPEAEEFLDPARLDAIVRKWADAIAWPVVIVQDGKEIPANDGTALWRRPKAEITAEAYEEFYHRLGLFWDKPWATLHWHAEGTTEFSALLFIPGMKPFAPTGEDRDSHVRLHVRRMFITDRASLLPPWLRFVQGVVDTDDLPLNVSREMLQATPVLARIRKALTNRVLTELKTRASAEDYAAFWDNFGAVLKEGVYEDDEHRAELAALLRLRSSAEEGLTTLAGYVGRMKPGQKHILYLAGDDAAVLAQSPQLEGYRARGIEVLLLTDPIDAFWPDRLGSFEGHPLASITREHGDLGAVPPPESAAAAAEVGPLVEKLKAALAAEISDVRPTERLVGSPVVLAGAAGADLHMQRLMRRAGQGRAGLAPVLEINPRHPWIARLAGLAESGADLTAEAALLLDLALVQEGDPPRHPAEFARRSAEAFARA